MKFYLNENINVKIDDSIIAYINDYQKYGDYCVEAGGILIGLYEPKDDLIVLTDLTQPQINDRCGRYHFKRDECGHQEIADELWEKSNHRKTYIGEWHTHQQDVPVPSFEDKRNWKKIDKRNLNYKWVFFIIVGVLKSSIWAIQENKVIKLGEWE